MTGEQPSAIETFTSLNGENGYHVDASGYSISVKGNVMRDPSGKLVFNGMSGVFFQNDEYVKGSDFWLSSGETTEAAMPQVLEAVASLVRNGFKPEEIAELFDKHNQITG